MSITLAEAAPPTDVEMPPEVARELVRLKIATVAPTLSSSVWTVSQVRKVGALSVGGVDVRIRPKVPFGSLFFLLASASTRSIWRDEIARFAVGADEVAVLARAFALELRRAIGGGLHRAYRSESIVDVTVRGRIDLAEQLRRRAGVPLPLSLEVDEFTDDIDVNRALRAALDRLLRLPQLDGRSRSLLLQQRPRLAHIPPLAAGIAVPKAPARVQRYVGALQLATLILAGASVQHERGGERSSAFLVTVAQVFEDFVAAQLRLHLERRAGRVIGQYSDRFDEAGRLTIRPDVVWLRDGSVAAVADAKYKAEKPQGFPHADVYQMHAYCSRFGMADGHLIYARGEEVPTVHVLRGSGVRVHCHAIDLSTPDAALASMARVADAIATATPGARSLAENVAREPLR